MDDARKFSPDEARVQSGLRRPDPPRRLLIGDPPYSAKAIIHTLDGKRWPVQETPNEVDQMCEYAKDKKLDFVEFVRAGEGKDPWIGTGLRLRVALIVAVTYAFPPDDVNRQRPPLQGD